MNPFRKKNQSEPAQATYVQPSAPYASDSNSLDSSLESTNVEAQAIAIQERDDAIARASERHQQMEQRVVRQSIVRYSVLGLIFLVAIGMVFLRLHAKPAKNTLSNVDQKYGTQTLQLGSINDQTNSKSTQDNSVDVNGQLHVNQALVLTPTAQPSSAVQGQVYYDQNTGQLSIYDGSTYQSILTNVSGVQSLGGAQGAISLGSGLSVDGGTLTYTAPASVLSVQGQTGDVTLAAGNGISVNGTTIANNGILSFGGKTGAITLGSGLQLNGNSLANSGVLGITGGSNITITPTGNGTFSISAAGGGGSGTIGGGGTTDKLAKFSGAQSIVDSIISDNGTTATISGGLTVTGLGSGIVQSSAGGTLSSGTIDRNSSLLSGALSVSNGGTGTSVLSNTNGAIYFNGTGLATTNSGTSGDCLLANTNAAPSFGTCPGSGGVSSVTATTKQTGDLTFNGTTNQVSVTNSGGTFTFATPQNINTTADVNFNSVNAASLLKTNGVTRIDASGNLSNIGTISTSGLITAGNGLTVSTGTVTFSALTGGASTCLTLNASHQVGTASCATGSGSSPTLQNVYDNSTTTPTINLASTGGGVIIQDAASSVGSNLFAVKNNGGSTTYFGVTTTGVTINNGLTAGGTIKFGNLTALNGALLAVNNSGTVSTATINLSSLPAYVSGTLGVGNGGTGSSSFTNTNGVIYYDGSKLTSTNTGTTGQCLVATTGSAPSFTTCTGAGGVSSITANNTAQTGALQFNGTSNQVSVTNSGGTFTFATPQDLATSSNVQFGSVNASTLIKTNGTQRIDASGNLSNIANITASGTINFSGLNSLSSGTCLVIDASHNLGTASCATGSGSNPTLQNVYDNSGSTPTIVLGTSGGAGLKIQDAATTVGGDLLAVTDNAGTTKYLNVTTNGAGVTGSLSVSSDVTVSSLSGGAAANKCLTTDAAGKLQLVACLSGAGGGSGGVTSINGASGSITLNNASTGSSTITIDNAKADGSTKGIASFASGNFTATSGNISIKTGGVTSTELLDGTIADADLSTGTFTHVTGTGALGAGSIGGSFGNIVTTNTITGNIVNGTAGVYTGGTAAGNLRIDASGNLSNIGTISTSGLITAGNGLTVSTGTVTLSNLTGGTGQCLTLDAAHHVGVSTCATGAGSNPTLQNVYDNSTTSPAIILSSTGGGLKLQDASSTVGVLFSVYDSTGTNPYFAIGNAGTSVNGNFGAAGTITFSGLASTHGGVAFVNPDGSLTVTSNAGTAGECLLSNGSGNAPSFATCPGNSALPTNGTATDNRISKFTSSATALTNSQIADDGTHVTVGNSGTSTGGLFNVGATDQFQVSSTGAVTSVGLNAGTGLIQGAGGLSLTLGASTYLTLNSAQSGTAASCLVLDASNHVVTTTCAAGTGGSSGATNSYIQNQNASAQTSAVFWISGAGRSDTSFLAPSFDTATAAQLNIGTGTANAISIGKSGVTTTINGSLSAVKGLDASGGAITLTGNAASYLKTSAGTLDIQGTGTTTLSTTNNGSGASAGITVQSGNSTAGTAGTVLIDTGTSSAGTSKVNIGTANASEIHLGNGSNAIKLDSSVTVAAGKSLTLTSGTGTITQTYANNTGSANTINASNSSTAGATVSALNIVATGTNATGSNIVNALLFGNASNGAGGTTTFNGLNFGTGYTNLLSSANATITGAGGLTLGAGNSTGFISVANNSATTTLNIATSATPTTAVINMNDTSAGVATDKLINLQAGGSPVFTVVGTGDITAGKYNTNTFTGTSLIFGTAGATSITSNGASALSLDTGGAAALNLGATNANAITISKAGVSTNVKGTLTVDQLLTASTGLTLTAGTFTNGGATVNITHALSDFAADGPIGTAAATVDAYTSFSINQTSGGNARALSLPSPTSTSPSRLIYVSNIGTASFIIAGVTVPAGANAGFLWNGAAWAASDVSTGISIIGALKTTPVSADGASISGNTIYLQSADTNYAGLIDTNAQTFKGIKTFNDLITGNNGLTVTNGAAIQLASSSADSSFVTTGGKKLTLTSGAATTWGTSAGDLTIQSAGSNLNLGLSGAGAVNIGSTGATANSSTVNIANSSDASSTQAVVIGSNANTNSSVNIEAGNTGKIQIGNAGTNHAIQIGTGAAGVQAVTVGSTNSNSTTTINGGSNGTTPTISLQAASTGVIAIGTTNGNTIQLGSVGTSANASTVSIANTSGNAQQTVAIGSNGNASSTVSIDAGTSASGINIGTSTTAHTINIATGGTAAQTVNIGSASSTSSVNIQGGTGNATGDINIGDSAVATKVDIGANDNGGATTVRIATNNSAAQSVTIGSTNASSSTSISGAGYTVGVTNTGVGINTAGTAPTADISFGNASNRSINILASGAATAGKQLTIQAGNSGTGAVNGGNLVLQAGATGGTGTTGSVIVKANGTESTTAFQVQKSGGAYLLNVDTSGGIVTLGGANKFTVDVNGNVTAAGTAAITGAVTLGTNNSLAGSVVFNTAAGSTGTVTLTTAAQTGNFSLSIPTLSANSTVCISTGNCSATGTAGGDLSGSYPNPTVAKVQNVPVTFTSPANGDVLMFSGTSSIINGKITNTNLSQGDFNNIKGLGSLDQSVSFDQNGGSGRSISIAQRTSGVGDNITISAGQGSTGNVGGNVILQGGANGTSGTTGSVLARADSTTAFAVQSANGGATYFNVNTSTGDITLGTGSNTVTFSAGGGLVASGTAQHVKYISLPAEYVGAVLDAASDTGGAVCSSNNNGTMTAGYSGDSSPRQNYYQWVSGTATSQCYDVVVQVPVPADFASWAGSGPSLYLSNTGASSSAVCMRIVNTTGATDSAYTGFTGGYKCNSATSTLASSTFTNPGSSYTAGSDYLTVKIRMTSTGTADLTKIGTLTFAYNSKY